MRKISLLILLFISVAFASTAAFASGGGSSPTDGICGPLKADGVTKGLFGLCVAYCEAGAASEKVLDNYYRKKSESDPEMPCLDVEEPTLNCACWNTFTEDELGVDVAVDPNFASCTLGTVEDTLFYLDGNTFDSEIISAFEGGCEYFNSVTGDSGSQTGLTLEQENECRLEVLNIAARDFQGFDCLAD